MTATLTVVDPGPPATTHRKRRTGPKVLGILLVWLVVWFVAHGRQTLALDGADTTSAQDTLTSWRDLIDSARSDNPLVSGLIGGLSDALGAFIQGLQYLMSSPTPTRPVPEIGWLGVVVVLAWVALAIAGWRSAVLVAVGLLSFGVLGLWQDSIDSLIVTFVSVLICVVIGLPIGILMARHRGVSVVMTPVLDVMQTMPSFAYLAPLALFWGIGAPSAVVATIVYAVPPLVRITEHAIRSLPDESIEAARSLGVTRGQLLRLVQLPMARRTIIVGLNQCTLAALSMAIIAALVNGPGLGEDVAQALQSLDVGSAVLGGLAIVVLAIMLDRTTTAASERSARAGRMTPAARRRSRIVVIATGLVALVPLYWSHVYVWAAQFPDPGIARPMADGINAGVSGFVSVVAPVTEALRNAVTYGLLNPLQAFLADSPWWLALAGILALAFVLGGLRALVAGVVCSAVIFLVGLWNDAMQTLTMTLVATVLVMVLAIVVGVWMGRSRRAEVVVRPVLDAFQTIPSFVYLVPALALFGASRFTAIIAAVVYSMPVATKLVSDGIRGVSETTMEAARASGATAWQLITKVQLPMARASIVLATNQGLLYVLSMVVIGGLVGAGSLGYLVVAGFVQDPLFGKGLAAGIAITAMGVLLDRITRYAAARQE